MLAKPQGVRAVDVDFIRSRFIQENLRLALLEQDREHAVRVLRSFRMYFQWFEARVPDLEKLTIMSQLARLEEQHNEASCAAGLGTR
jgi:hypothetical protein